MCPLPRLIEPDKKVQQPQSQDSRRHHEPCHGNSAHQMLVDKGLKFISACRGLSLINKYLLLNNLGIGSDRRSVNPARLKVESLQTWVYWGYPVNYCYDLGSYRFALYINELGLKSDRVNSVNSGIIGGVCP